MDPGLLFEKVEKYPKHTILFGAGASYGSDEDLKVKELLPPLGNELFVVLHKEPGLKSWNELAPDIATLFGNNRFEIAMDMLESDAEWSKGGWKRDLDLARFFSKFSIRRQNIYNRLSIFMSLKLRLEKWSGVLITLNYERLLEEALLLNNIFPISKGVTFFDVTLDLEKFHLIEVCYPHGACQFFIPQNYLMGEVSVTNSKLAQTGGVNHLLLKEHIPISCDNKCFPMICRYQSTKEPTIGNYFIDFQKARAIELIKNAQTITIIGVLCSPQDNHLWEPLGQTNSIIYYVEPYPEAQEHFRKWSIKYRKKEDKSFYIIPRTFNEAFKEIIDLNEL